MGTQGSGLHGYRRIDLVAAACLRRTILSRVPAGYRSDLSTTETYLGTREMPTGYLPRRKLRQNADYTAAFAALYTTGQRDFTNLSMIIAVVRLFYLLDTSYPVGFSRFWEMDVCSLCFDLIGYAFRRGSLFRAGNGARDLLLLGCCVILIFRWYLEFVN